MKKTVKNILFIIFLSALFLAYNIFRYRVYGDMNGIRERLIYAAVFACFMIIAGFKARPLPLVSLLIVSGAAHMVDGEYLFTFAPVFFSIFFMKTAAQNTNPKTGIAACIASQGLLGASIAVLAFRLWLMLFRSAFVVTERTLYLICLVIFSVCLALTALLVKVILTKKYGDTKDFSKQTLPEQFFLPYVNLYAKEQKTYKKKKARRMPVNFIYVLEAVIIALTAIYYKKVSFYGAARIIWVIAWLFLILATVCFLKRIPLLPSVIEDDDEIVIPDETDEDNAEYAENKTGEKTDESPAEEITEE